MLHFNLIYVKWPAALVGNAWFKLELRTILKAAQSLEAMMLQSQST
jgi:hypothetical protein